MEPILNKFSLPNRKIASFIKSLKDSNVASFKFGEFEVVFNPHTDQLQQSQYNIGNQGIKDTLNNQDKVNNLEPTQAEVDDELLFGDKNASSDFKKIVESVCPKK